VTTVTLTKARLIRTKSIHSSTSQCSCSSIITIYNCRQCMLPTCISTADVYKI